MAGRILIGVSGWRYPPWRGHFYPAGLAQARELDYVAQVFPSVELNGSFYSLQRPSSYAMWARQTPPGFVFAVKGGRFITHMLKLRNARTAIANFFASGLFELGDKLGPLLWQFPPQFGYDRERFENFFRVLPRTTAAAAELAQERDERLQGRESLIPERNRQLRHAVEVRHPSFATPDFIALLREYRIGWVVADTPQPWPLYEDVTADFVYVPAWLHRAVQQPLHAGRTGALGRMHPRVGGRRPAGGRPADRARVAAAPRCPRRLLLLRQYRQAARAGERARADGAAGSARGRPGPRPAGSAAVADGVHAAPR